MDEVRRFKNKHQAYLATPVEPDKVIADTEPPYTS
jgi:replication-associated recombination protein RarA